MTITVDMRDVERGMTALEKRQLPQAGVWALNDTAYDILTDLQDRMDVVFDRPTRFTKNAFMVWRATKKTMEAAVQERPSVGKRHYLKVQEGGGARGQTGLERMLQGTVADVGHLGAVIPTSSARTDSFGNWSAGERNQAVSAIKGWREAGYSANATKGSVKRNSRKRAAYFVSKQGSALSSGIWKRAGKGGITKIAHFIDSSPSYTANLGFQEGAEAKYAERLPINFAAAFAKAMATAK